MSLAEVTIGWGEDTICTVCLAPLPAGAPAWTDRDGTGGKLHAAADRAAERGAMPERTSLMDGRAQAHRDCAAALREAITRALTGEDNPS